MNSDCTCDYQGQNCKAYCQLLQPGAYSIERSHHSLCRPCAGEGDPLRELNRCIPHGGYCVPRAHSSSYRSKSLSAEINSPLDLSISKIDPRYNASISKIDPRYNASISKIDPRYNASLVHYCDLQDEEWSTAHLHRSYREQRIKNERSDVKYSRNNHEMTFDERNNHSSDLREIYIREMAALKARLHELRRETRLSDNRERQRSESEPGFVRSCYKVHKRPRDLSPLPQPSQRWPSDNASSSKYSTQAEDKTQAYAPMSVTRFLDLKSKCIEREKGYSVKEKLSDAEDSECSENDTIGDEANDDLLDDYSLHSGLTSGSNDTNAPSHVGRFLGSICLNESSEEELASNSSPVVPSNLPIDKTFFRPSLFVNVPPYIRFALHDIKGPGLPAEISKHLKWKLSTITPIVIRRTLVNSGFRLIRKSNDWTGQWGKHMNSFLFKTLKDFQKLNHFPGTFQIGRKDRLWKNLNRLMHKFGSKEFGFIPTTYILPQDNKSLRIAWEKTCGKGQWIVKPPAAARGTGIRVVHKWSDIPKNKPLIVQKYISQPYLINGSKFDLRLYVLMTSIHPLRIYLYDDGLVRFASVKYSENVESLGDRFMHLTNYSINKLSNQYRANEDATSCHGHKWTLKTLWIYLEKQGVNVKALQKNVTDLVIKTIISGESHIQALSKNNLTSRYCSYELFGIDVLLDSALRPWLLEVNISPSLHSSSPLDLAVKGPLVRELLNLAGFQVPAKLTQEQDVHFLNVSGLADKCSTLCYDKRLYTNTLSREERIKHASLNGLQRKDYMTCILDNLTPDDVRHLIQFEDELTQLQRFEKIFPTANTHTYHQFFDSPRYYNMMFDAWECKYHGNRLEGIHVLNELCKENIHLQVPFPGSKTKYSVNRSDPNATCEPKVEDEEENEDNSRDSTRPSSRCGKRRKTGVPTKGFSRTSLPSRRQRLWTSESIEPQSINSSQPWRNLLQSCKFDAVTPQLPPINVPTNS